MDIHTLNTLPDEELTQLIEEARRIIARRSATALIPEQIESLAREYLDSGGDQSALVVAVTPKDPQVPPLE